MIHPSLKDLGEFSRVTAGNPNFMRQHMELPKVNVTNILYATDLSDNARYAFAYAMSLANHYCAKLVLLHVLPEVPELLDNSVTGYISAERWEGIKKQHFHEAQETLTGKRLTRGREAVKEVLTRFCETTLSGSEKRGPDPDEVVVLRGNPVEQILTQAEEKNCDLIVMGSHGYGTLKDAMIGGTARRVLRRAHVPVLLVRLPEE